MQPPSGIPRMARAPRASARHPPRPSRARIVVPSGRRSRGCRAAGLLAALTLTLLLVGCGGGSGPPPTSSNPGSGNPGSPPLVLSAMPSSLAVPAGETAAFTLGVSPASASPVTLTLLNAPAGVQLSAGAGTTAGSGQQNEVLDVAASTATGTYALTLSGSSGGATATTGLALLVEPALPASLAQLEQSTFEYFWNTTNPANGLAPDHYPGSPYASIAATGFALTAYPIGVERGWITRAQAEQRVLTTLQFLGNAPQGPAASGESGYQGFFYHFLDLNTGQRWPGSELSSIDTALLMAGVLTDESYFNQNNTREIQIRALADQLYRAVNWTWMQPAAPTISLGWLPESGYLPYNWQGYNEAMILYIEALGSPTHPVSASAWAAWTATYPNTWGSYFGRQQLGFAPLFGHQYSQAWIDFRGIQDAFMRSVGSDYFINSGLATESQRDYAIANPGQWTGYGSDLWGLTACDGPGNFTLTDGSGRQRTFYGYAARGAAITGTLDDGTIAPAAALGSIVFAPAIVIPMVQAMQARYGAYILGAYGDYDAFNPSFQYSGVTPATGTVVPGVGWVDSQYLGIDQGPILLMLENYRSGLIWNVMRLNPYIGLGLERANFTGGWLAGTPALQ